MRGVAGAVLIGWCGACPVVQADTDPGRPVLELSLGQLNGRSQEMVYEAATGAKVSQLLWDIDQAPTLQASLRWPVRHWLELSLAGWGKIGSGNSHMVDYDWLSPDQSGWSDRSTHPDTQLQRAYQAEAAATFWAWQAHGWQLGALLGYQRNEYQWQARGGSFVYSDTGFRDLQGSFEPGEKGITYRQTFRAPLAGLVARYQWQAWSLEARWKYSRWINADDYDIHHLRDTTFAGSGDEARLHAGSLALSYALTPQMALRGSVDYQEYREGRGPVSINAPDGSFTDRGEAGGMSNRTVHYAAGLSYRF